MILLLCNGLFSSLLAAAAPPPMTLEEVLRRARDANLKLPQATLETEAADRKVREARAERWMKVAVDGDFIYAPPGGYDPVVTNAGEARLQLTAKQPILDGGARKAAIDRARSDRDAARARLRVAEKDLEVEVRSRFAEWLEADAEITARRNGLERLGRYRTSLESRKASGQGIAADLLKTQVRLASDEGSATWHARSLRTPQAVRGEVRHTWCEIRQSHGRRAAAPLVPSLP